MKSLNLYFYSILLLSIIISSCSTAADEELHDRLMTAYKEQLQIEPIIRDVQIDTAINKSQVIDYFNKVDSLEKEKQLADNRRKLSSIKKSLETGRHWYWNRDLTDQERKESEKNKVDHEEIIRSVLNGGKHLDSTITLIRIKGWKRKLSVDSLPLDIKLVTVKKSTSETSEVTFDRWIDMYGIKDGKYHREFIFTNRKESKEEFMENILNSFVSFDPNKKYREKMPWEF